MRDNSSASVRVIYYLYSADVTAWFFSLTLSSVARKCNFIAWHSCWLQWLHCYDMDMNCVESKVKNLFCKGEFSLSLTCPVVYFLTAVYWEKPSGGIGTLLAAAWLDDNFFPSPLMLCAGGLMWATTQSDWRVNTRNSEQGRKTLLNGEDTL